MSDSLWSNSPPGSSVQGILQARILEWVTISFSRDLPDPGIKPWSPALQADSVLSEPPGKVKKAKAKSLSRVRLFATPWTVAHQAPQSMEFSRQEYWSGLPFPSPGIFPTQGSNPGLLHIRQTLYHLSQLTTGFWSVAPFTSKGVPSVYFGFFCLQVSSVSNFCSDTRGQRWSLI